MDDLRVREGMFTKKLLKMWSESNLKGLIQTSTTCNWSSCTKLAFSSVVFFPGQEEVFSPPFL